MIVMLIIASTISKAVTSFIFRLMMPADITTEMLTKPLTDVMFSNIGTILLFGVIGMLIYAIIFITFIYIGICIIYKKKK
jgi:hypothetical protein